MGETVFGAPFPVPPLAAECQQALSAALPIDYLPRDITTAGAAERFNKEDAHLRRVLRDALALAIALNRTLVLPRMLCYCDNIWKEMKHCRVGGAFGMTLPFDCPADHIINLPRWFAGDVRADPAAASHRTARAADEHTTARREHAAAARSHAPPLPPPPPLQSIKAMQVQAWRRCAGMPERDAKQGFVTVLDTLIGVGWRESSVDEATV